MAATYAGIGNFTASVKLGEKTIDCGTVAVTGAPVTDCKCTVDDTTPNVATGSQTVTWTVSGCKAGTVTQGDGWKYAWTGATGSSTTANATVSKKGDTKSASVTVTSPENATMEVKTCPSVKATDLSQPDNFTCTVSKSSINFGESFTFTVDYSSNGCWSSSITGDGVTSTNCGTSFTITPTSAGDKEYEYTLSGAGGKGTCVKLVTVTDNSSTWTPKAISLSYDGAAQTLESGYIYTITYTSNRGQLVCDGSGSISCNGGTPKAVGGSAGAYSNCTTVKVYGSASCKNTW